MEKHCLQVRDSKDNHFRQRSSVRQSGIQVVLLELRHQEQELITRTPSGHRQIEVTNRTLLRLIKSRLVRAKGAWPEELPNVLWAYRTTTQTPTGETPFNLTYGTEAVIPVEVGLTSLRREFFDKQSNNDQLKQNLDFLDEVRDQAA